MKMSVTDTKILNRLCDKLRDDPAIADRLLEFCDRLRALNYRNKALEYSRIYDKQT